jgi:Putative Actinobacterial Holin-X, holin superfamily III
MNRSLPVAETYPTVENSTPEDRSLADLVKQLSDHSTTLVRQEIELAKAELAVKGKHRVKQGVPPVPEQTVESVKEDVEWTKQRANEGRR